METELKEALEQIRALKQKLEEAEGRKDAEASEAQAKELAEVQAKLKESETKVAAAAKEKALGETKAANEKAIAETKLPDVIKDKLRACFTEGADAEAVEKAIKAETDCLAKLTEAGMVHGLGPADTPDDKKALTESMEKQAYLREIRDGKSEEDARKFASLYAAN